MWLVYEVQRGSCNSSSVAQQSLVEWKWGVLEMFQRWVKSGRREKVYLERTSTNWMDVTFHCGTSTWSVYVSKAWVSNICSNEKNRLTVKPDCFIFLHVYTSKKTFNIQQITLRSFEIHAIHCNDHPKPEHIYHNIHPTPSCLQV